MNKIFRLPGLLVFLLLSILITVFIYFYIDNVIEKTLESVGESVFDAKVDIGSVNLRLADAAMDIHDVAVADSKAPMQNLFEIRQATAEVDFLKMFLGKYIVRELSVSGLELSTPRTVSGALTDKKDKQGKDGKTLQEEGFVKKQFAAVKQSLPDVSDVLAREPLLTEQRKEEWDKAYQLQKERWESIDSQLPDKEKLAIYEKRLETITKGDVKSVEDYQTRKKQLDQLQDDIKQDKKLLKEASAELVTTRDVLQDKLSALKKAPKQDIERIRKKYSLDDGGIANLSGLLFGDNIRQYTGLALTWYRKLEPALSSSAEKEGEARPKRKNGRFVDFPVEEPLPDFLVKTAVLEMVLALGKLDVRINDLTHQQDVTGVPTTAVVDSSALEGMKHLYVSGVFDYRQKHSINTIDLRIDELLVNDIKISGGSDLPLNLASSKAQVKGNLRIEKKQLKGTVHGDFSEAVFKGNENQKLSGFAREIMAVLQSINQFDMDVNLSGKLKSPDMDIKSDLDKRMKTAFSQRLDAKKQEFQKELDLALNNKLASYLKDTQKLDTFNSEHDDVKSKIKNLDKLLEAELDSYKDKEKDKLENKLEDKLKGKLKGLF